VFTARYALSPYIKQIRFVFKFYEKPHGECSCFICGRTDGVINMMNPLVVFRFILRTRSKKIKLGTWNGQTIRGDLFGSEEDSAYSTKNGGIIIFGTFVSIPKHTAVCPGRPMNDTLSLDKLRILQAPECVRVINTLAVYTLRSTFYWIPLMSLYVVLLCCLWSWSGPRYCARNKWPQRYSALTF
jgi:hypothetical protein